MTHHFSSIISLLESSKRVLIGSHHSPDGDALGSSLALASALRQLGKHTTVFNRDPVPANLRFLEGSEHIVSALPVDVAWDVAMIIDCAQFSRVGGDFEQRAPGCRTICIDHHRLERTDAEHYVIDADAAATGVLVAELIDLLGVTLTQGMAQQLYCALAVDTGFFRYSNTDADVLALAATLVTAGARPGEISQNLDESFPPERLRLLGLALSSLHIEPELHYANMSVTQEMMRRVGATLEMADDFAHIPRSIAGVEVSALFREAEDGVVKVSLRSKSTVDVSEVSKLLGGGGHMHAAGCRIRADLSEAQRRVREAIQHLQRK